MHEELAGEAGGVLEDDGADTIAFNAIEQPRKPLYLPSIGIGAAYRLGVGDLETSSLGEKAG